MNTVPRSPRPRELALCSLLLVLSGCHPANSPAAASAPVAPQAQAQEPRLEPEASAQADEHPLTLLADPPPPKAQPVEPVSQRGWLGVSLGRAPAGAVVDRVVPGSPADKVGLEAGDVITRVAGQAVLEPADVVRIVAQHQAGERVPLSLENGKDKRLLAVELAGRPEDSDITRMSFVGQPAPELGMLATVQGSVTPTLQALRGKVVVLEFWASWCTVCRFMVPTLNEWQARFGPEGVVVLGVTADPVTVASNAAGQLGIDYHLASDRDGTATRAYSANAVPTIFIIDQRGMVREVIVGYSESRLAAAETLIDGLLSGS